MKLSDEAVAAFAQVIGNDTQAIAKRKGIPEARQTYGCSALRSRLRDASWIDDRKRLSARKER